ncbi:sugar ABC transporter substrate-binding protein [Nocardioides sp. LS1]|uniref:sugar ABC transporter substrate-binding protein n=1 Tax=Nocardioides sp. LS1 TaxID=1027620 RepID=UPI000F616F69|nr:sugar ABC transporter substrate-binding protein [Nocardioides sp. LS1]GCD88109.1 sugar ABC transporter substrate-binding protein [Nocardioides sp. LS1]
MNTRDMWRRGVALVAAATLGLGLAACGSSASAGHGKTSEADQKSYQATLDAWYKGTYKKPSGPTVQAPSGKSIWLIESGLGSDYATRGVAAAEETAKKLGWTVHVFDAKYDPTQMLTGVQQAVVAKADGIILSAIDCPTVKNAVVQAKAAGIPVVGVETKDCTPALLSHVVTYAGHESFEDQDKDWGGAQAAWVIAKTNGQAKVVLDTETDAWTTLTATEGIKREIAKCSGCSIVGDATFVGTDLGPALQQKIEQILVQHPEANAFIPAYDVVMTQSGGAQAMQTAGRLKSLAIGGGEGTTAGIDQIRNGTGEQACAGQSVEWEVYSAVDTLIRLFLDQDPNEVDTGNGIQVCDKDHNLPPAGQPYTPPVDFRSAFLAMWSVS